MRAELDRQMRDVLAQIETCSHVPAAGWGPKGRSRSSDEHPGGGRPPGDTGHTRFAHAYGPPFSEATNAYWQARTDEDRQRVLDEARAELAHIRGQTERPRVAGETSEQRNRRIVTEGEGFTVREVAIRFRCGERDVRRARTEADREPELGHEIESPDRHRVRELHGKGRTIASLTIQFGVSRSTVERWIGRRKSNGRAA